MKTPDYLHSVLLMHECNDEVFQKTYQFISKISKEITMVETIALNLSAEDTKKLAKVNFEKFELELVDLINYTIHNFRKDH